jgi:hypothetical protein
MKEKKEWRKGKNIRGKIKSAEGRNREDKDEGEDKEGIGRTAMKARTERL